MQCVYRVPNTPREGFELTIMDEKVVPVEGMKLLIYGYTHLWHLSFQWETFSAQVVFFPPIKLLPIVHWQDALFDIVPTTPATALYQ